MSLELTCKVIIGSLGAVGFTYASLSNPPVALLGGLLSGVGGFTISDWLCDAPNRKVCNEVYGKFDAPNSGWPEYIASKTTGLPSHIAPVKAKCLEQGTYYPPTTPPVKVYPKEVSFY